MSGQIKIIGGQYKGKKITVPTALDCRPTSNRIRESVFNILQFEIREAICLDAFAGSGAMGLEAYSRGAQQVIFLEKQHKVFINLKKNIESFQIPKERFELHHIDCQEYLQNTKKQFDIIFLDPPFRQNFWDEISQQIINRHLLKENGIIYLEAPTPIATPDPKWELYKHKKVGMVYYHFFKLNPSS